MRRRAAAPLLAAVLGMLAACSSSVAPPPTPSPEIMVTGDAGDTPTLTYVAPLVVDHAYRQTVWPGTGPALVDGGPVLLRYWIENGTTASLVSENYSTVPQPQTMSVSDLGTDLYQTLKGQRVGARLLQVTPPGTEPDQAYPAVTVVDVMPTRASGTAVARNAAMPKVTLAADGAPSITPTGKAAPTQLQVQALLRGVGRQVEATDMVTLQYTAFRWDTGESVDSTWERGEPSSFALSDVPALSQGLVEQTTNSQVMVVVPPSYDLGATASQVLAGQTLVFVVDILWSGPVSPGS